jgi:hypothetical protein
MFEMFFRPLRVVAFGLGFWNLLLPLAGMLGGAVMGKKKTKGIEQYPQFQQAQHLVNQQQQRIANTSPLYDALIRMSIGRLPGYMQRNPDLQSYQGLTQAPKRTAQARAASPGREDVVGHRGYRRLE